MSPRQLIRQAARSGWSATQTAGGHLRLRHPDAAVDVIVASTPSCPRAIANAAADLRRALPKPKPLKPRRPKPKLPIKKRKVAEIRQAPPPLTEKLNFAEFGQAPSPRPRQRLPGGPPVRLTARWWA